MIHVILVNYNGTDDTIACVGSLQAIRRGAITITIVDNASDEHERKRLCDWGVTESIGQYEDNLRSVPAGCEMFSSSHGGEFTSIRLNIILSPVNLGYAGGNNIGLSIAIDDPAMQYVWVLNNDTELDENALAALVQRVEEDHNIGICGSTLVYYDNRAMVQALGGRFNSLMARPEQIFALSSIETLPPLRRVEAQLEYVIGASMLVTRIFLEAVGLMDDKYFLYFEELDWAERGAGRFRLGWAPDSLVYHKEGGAIGTSSRRRPSDMSIYYMWRSTLRFLYLHKPFLLPLGVTRLCLRAGLYMARGDGRAAIVMARAMVHAMSGRVGNARIT